MKNIQYFITAIGFIILASCKTQQATVTKVEEKKEPSSIILKSGKWILQDENGSMKGFNNESIYVAFNEITDKQITGFAGCNQFSGPVSFNDDGSLKVGMLLASKRYCADFPNEGKIMSLLSKSNKYSIDNNILRLFDGEVELLRFKLDT